jgi:hypothetical protein
MREVAADGAAIAHGTVGDAAHHPCKNRAQAPRNGTVLNRRMGGSGTDVAESRAHVTAV